MSNRSKLAVSVKLMMETGHSVDFGRIVICDLGNYLASRRVLPRRYQVESTDARLRFSQIYENLDVAVDKFCALRNALIERARNDSRNQ